MAMKITVIGLGYLGATHAIAMAELGHDVIGIEANPKRLSDLQNGVVPFYEPGLDEALQNVLTKGNIKFQEDHTEESREADLHFLCVGTPQLPGSYAANTEYLHSAVKALAPYLREDAVVAGKSTVPVGTSAALTELLAKEAGFQPHLAWNPEFLREGFAVEDTLHPDRLVVGVRSAAAEERLREVYAPVIAEGVPFLVTDFPTAELVKVAANSFLATKISFINAISEVCEAAANLYYGKDNRQFSGLCIPDDVLRDNFAETHELGANQRQTLLEDQIRLAAMNPNSHLGQRALNVSTFSAGGALVGTDLLGGSLIDILRNAVLIGQGPMAVTELGGLVGNVAIPKQTGTTTVYWLAEGASVTESQETFAQLVLTPHRMGVYTGYTKQLLAQASISVEAFVRSDQAQAMAVEEDRVTIQGTGIGGEPTGILNTTGTLSNVTFSGAATWADMVALEYGLENANVRNGQMAILTSPLTKSYLKQTPVIAASTFPIFLWGKNEGFPTINGVMPGVVNEYPAYATKNMTNQMIQGVFSNLFKARWAGFDVVVQNWRMVAAAPGLSDEQKAKVAADIEKLNASAGWTAMLESKGWANTYLAGDAFTQQLAADTAATEAVLRDIGLVK